MPEFMEALSIHIVSTIKAQNEGVDLLLEHAVRLRFPRAWPPTSQLPAAAVAAFVAGPARRRVERVDPDLVHASFADAPRGRMIDPVAAAPDRTGTASTARRPPTSPIFTP